jgi:hypothetical protein
MINPIEKSWGVMHRHVTPNKCHAPFAQFRIATLAFPTREAPKNWPSVRRVCHREFRVIDPKDIRVLP